MAQRVQREGNRILFSGRLNTTGTYWILSRLREAKEKGYEEYLLDFTQCEVAFPDGLVPLVAVVDSWRADGCEFDLILPREETVSRFFLRSNVAHFLHPAHYDYTQTIFPRQVSVRRYDSLEDQVAIITEFVNVALNTTSLSRDLLQGLEWSLNEIMDNVLVHSQSSRGGFAQLVTFEDRIAFTVADTGRGILSSLQEGYPALTRDVDAIGEALKAGVTRNPQFGQGNGLAGTLRIATLSGGSFTVGSRRGIVSVFRQGSTSESHGNSVPWHQEYPGTVVSSQIFRNADFKISEALAFPGFIGGVYDLIEARYETDDGRAFLMKMKQEAPGFGSREAGRQIRIKLSNLLAADQMKSVVVDWDGVPLISSSFADEALGKLFIELGPTRFASRIRFVNMDNLVRGLVDKAILQRTAQAMNEAAKSEREEPSVANIKEAALEDEPHPSSQTGPEDK